MKKTLIAVLLACTPAALADDWPQWRGPRRDNVSHEKGLLQTWPKAGPKLLWTYKEAGLGFSGPAVVGDRLYTMGARGDIEYVIALDIAGGKVKQAWASLVGPIFLDPLKSYGDGPRSTPTVDGKHVYALGGQGVLVCLSADDGSPVWKVDLVKDLGGEVMELNPPTNWGYCESVLVDGDRVVCSPGGSKGTFVAFDKAASIKGRKAVQRWRSAALKDQATDSSIVVLTVGGVRQYVNTTFKSGKAGAGIAGVSADSGALLWYYSIPRSKGKDLFAAVPTPIIKDDLVYASNGYDVGCNLVQITTAGKGKFKAVERYSKSAQRNMINEHGGVVLVGGDVYGYCDSVGWVCQELLTGKMRWRERNALEGKGSLTAADGRLYLVSDQGEVVLLAPDTKAWSAQGEFKLPELSKTHETRPSHASAGVWTHPVVANGRLYLRDQDLLFCYDVRDPKAKAAPAPGGR
jgi:outer membrane protein assembly factor BamB